MGVPEGGLVNESRCLLDLSSGSLAETKYSTAFSLSWSLVRFEYKHYVLKLSNYWISYTFTGHLEKRFQKFFNCKVNYKGQKVKGQS